MYVESSPDEVESLSKVNSGDPFFWSCVEYTITLLFLIFIFFLYIIEYKIIIIVYVFQIIK